jgi:hypothetical protein
VGRASLGGIDLKLNRAKERFDTLSQAIKDFIADEDSYSIALEQHGQGRATFRVSDVKRPPPEWGLLIGECVHQYRSALDHLVFQLVLSNRRGYLPARVVKRSEFPIFNSGPRFRGRRNRKGEPSSGSGRAKIQDIPKEARAAIERLQPYHRRKNPEARSLWQLHELANVDKHRLLHVTYSSFQGSSFTIHSRNVAELRGFDFRPGPLKRNAVVAEWQAIPIDPRYGTEMNVEGEIMTDIIFGKASAARAVRGLSVTKTLFDIGAFIASDVLPPLCDLMGLTSAFKPGRIIDIAAMPPDERDTVSRTRIQLLNA